MRFGYWISDVCASDLGAHAIERGFLLVVLRLDRGERLGQRRDIQPCAFAGELFSTTFGVQRLAVEVIDAGAFDVAGTRRLGLRPGVCIPALMPRSEEHTSEHQSLMRISSAVF